MKAVKDVWGHPQRVPWGHLPLSVIFEVEALTFKGFFWKAPKPFRIPPSGQDKHGDLTEAQNAKEEEVLSGCLDDKAEIEDLLGSNKIVPAVRQDGSVSKDEREASALLRRLK